MNYLLTVDACIESARRLGRLLNMEVTTTNKEEPPTVRFGSAKGSYENEFTTFNTKESIVTVSNKALFSQFIEESNINGIVLNFGKPVKYPVIIRTLVDACCGEGIVIARSEEDWKPYRNYLWSYYIPFTFEIRAHVLDGKIVKIYKKVFVKEGEESDVIIRNVANGYQYKMRRVDLYPKAANICQSLFDKLNMRMFGVDLGWSKDTGYVAIEVNSGPELVESTAEIYSSFISSHLEN